MYEGVNVGDKDFSALIAKMKEAGVSVVYYGGLHTEAGLIMRQLADQGLKATFMSGDGIVSNELASIAGDAVDGTLMTFAPDPRKNPAAQGTRREVPRRRLRAGSLHALLLRRDAGRSPTPPRPPATNDPQKVAEGAQGEGPVQDRDRRHRLRREGRHRPVRTTSCTTWKKGDDGKYTYFEM